MMNSEQDEKTLLEASNKTIVSKALLIVSSAIFILGFACGLAVYHFLLL